MLVEAAQASFTTARGGACLLSEDKTLYLQKDTGEGKSSINFEWKFMKEDNMKSFWIIPVGSFIRKFGIMYKETSVSQP